MPLRDHYIMESRSTAESPLKLCARERDEDRISQLPDPILHLILSLLHANEAVQTGVLSRRWLNLSASMPCITLDDEIFMHREQKWKFKHFINMLLLLRDVSNLHTFCLKWGDSDPEPIILDKWIRFALKQNVKILKLDVKEKGLDLPDCFFTCQSLEEFRYTHFQCPSISAPEFTRLDRLKILYLCNVYLLRSVKRFIAGCPALEDLELQSCTMIADDIISHKLKRLVIEGCNFEGSRIRISCQILESFHFVNALLVDHETLGELIVLPENLSSLRNAFIESYLMETVSEIDIIMGLSNAHNLKFSSPEIQFISARKLSRLPPFCNLVNLTLGGWRIIDNFPAVAHFIHNSPKLGLLELINEKSIYIDEEEVSVKSEQLWFHCPHTVISCRVECGEDNEKLLDLVSNVIVNKYIITRSRSPHHPL